MKIIKIIPFILIIMTCLLFAAVDYTILSGSSYGKIQLERKGIETVSIEGSSLNARVEGKKTGKTEIYVSDDLLSEKDIDDAKLKKSGEKLEDFDITFDKEKMIIKKISGSDKPKHILLYIPEKTSLSSFIKNGNINVSGLEGKIDLKTQAGNVELQNIRGPVNAEMTAGNITANKLHGDFKGTIKVGNIKLSDVQNLKIIIENQSGNINLDKIRSESLILDSKTGNIKMDDCEINDLTIDHKMGDITINSIKGDSSVKLNMGNLNISDLSLLNKRNSDLETKFGNINLSFKDPELYDLTKISEDEITACSKKGKCVNISKKFGKMNVK